MSRLFTPHDLKVASPAPLEQGLIVVMVLKNVNLSIPAGRFTAIVGASGSGKSTIIQLLERFYDPVAGQIILDGYDIKNINLRHLRSCMSLVSQEPVLFATTIYENISHGYLLLIPMLGLE